MNVLDRSYMGGDSAVKLAASIESAVREGRLRPGEQLPTVRAVAVSLGLSPSTVDAAYRSLRTRGVLIANGRRGTRVSHRPPLPTRVAAPLPAGVRNLADGNPDPMLLPRSGRVLAALELEPQLYGGEAVVPELRALGLEALAADGLRVSSLAVVGGALDGIERALQAQLRPGDKVAVEDPGFTRLLDLLAALGLLAVPVEIDDSGMIPGSLEGALKEGVQAAILTPRAQNPTGAALDAVRARELRRLLRGYPELFVVEDDHAGPIAGVAALTVCEAERARWALVRSVSKWLGPDLRLAFLTGDAATVSRVEGRQRLGTGYVSHILQRLVLGLWRDPASRRLLERAAATYRVRREALINALARRGIRAHGRSGLNVWIPVPEEARVMQALLEGGWGVSGGERFRIKSSPAVRVTIATLKPTEAGALAASFAASLATRSRTYSA